MNQTDLIKDFIINTASAGNVGEAKIFNNQLIHFNTPILERTNNGFIFNRTSYSDVTRFFQKKILSNLQNQEFVQVDKVSQGYKGSLADFLKEK